MTPLRISRVISLYILLLFTSLTSNAAKYSSMVSDTIRSLNEITVNSQRPSPFQPLVRIVASIGKDEIEHMPAKSLNDIIKYIQGADLRSRGAEGVQSDLNLLGGTFDQTMVFINGVNFTDPQSGHHSLNIPIELSQIERIEILHGAGAWSQGAIAYAGAINIITKNSETGKVDLSLFGGEHNYLKGEGNLSLAVAERGWRVSFQAGGGYGKSDGYTGNTDFNIVNLYTAARFTKGENHKLFIQSGYQHKAFGANSFYTPAYPNQFEEIRCNLASAQYIFTTGVVQIQGTLYHRKHSDRFELFRYESPSWYSGHNYHLTNIAGANTQAAVKWRKAGTSVIGIDYRYEQIYSTVLGDPITDEVKKYSAEGVEYTKEKDRGELSLYLRHILQLERVRLTGGLTAQHGTGVFGGIAASYTITPYLELNGWLNHSGRNPTFTDLYYKSPTQTGNIDLKSERSLSGQLGLKYSASQINASLSLFYRYGFRIIDWTRESGYDQWVAGNLTNIGSAGADIAIFKEWRDSWVKKVGVSYSFLNVEKYSNNLHSLYATDYLKHKATVHITHNIIKRLIAGWNISFQKREGSWLNQDGAEVPYRSFILTDLRLSWQERNFSIIADITNLLDVDYLYIGNLPQPGRWIKLGILVTIR